MNYRLSPSKLARFFFHQCERYLLYRATPRELREDYGVPRPRVDTSPLTASILDRGFSWEKVVIEKIIHEKVDLAKGVASNEPGRFSIEETTARLQQLKAGRYVFQSTIVPPASFYERYGLDQDAVQFVECHPDLIEASNGLLRIHDLKASDELKTNFRIQVALYAVILRDMLQGAGVSRGVDMQTGGIWLYNQMVSHEFDLTATLRILESFLREKLSPILQKKPADANWHFNFRCEWCEYFTHCQSEAKSSGSVSLIPYLTVGGRDFLRAEISDGSVQSLSDLDKLVSRPDAEQLLSGSGSLRNRQTALKYTLEALKQGKLVLLGSTSLAFPVFEQVQYTLTLQREPVSGRIYAAGFRRFCFRDGLFEDKNRTEVYIASAPADCARIASEFLTALHDEFSTISDYNQGKEWKDQLSVQSYVFDGYERTLLEDLLIESVQRPHLSAIALSLYFYFHSENLADAAAHPAVQVVHPICVLTSVIRSTIALPVHVAIHLADASAILRHPDYSFVYSRNNTFSFTYANPMKSDALFALWDKGLEDRREWIQKELVQRLRAASSVVSGLRHFLKDKLFAWPAKFQLIDRFVFRSPILSRLAFVSQYETFLGALGTREARTRSREERITQGLALQLRFRSDGAWEPVERVEEHDLFVSQFPGWILVPDTEQGERDMLAYDDFRFRAALYPPSSGTVRLAALTDVFSKNGLVTAVQLELKAREDQQPFRPGQTAWLCPRFTDFNGRHILERLQIIDGAPDHVFQKLLSRPGEAAVARPFPEALAGAIQASKLTDGFTPSQRAAFAHFCASSLTLVWGPPGTGKTHFLALSLVTILRAAETSDCSLRIAICAFTHAAIENLLKKILEIDPGLADIVQKLGPVRRSEAALQSVEPGAAFSAGLARQVLGGTVFAFRKALQNGGPRFDVLVVDEASQMRFGDFSLISGLAASGKLVFAGDDLQLPPIVQGRYPEPEDGLPGLENSIFAYLRARDESGFTQQLLENWRMNTTLCDFPARMLYGEGYRPATDEVASRRLELTAGTQHSQDLEWILDPAWPIALCIFEDLRTSAENEVEAEMVAELAAELRMRLLHAGVPYPETPEGDRAFWKDGLFIVSPHHVQIRAIRNALGRKRTWLHEPFVDTVDKMQGQECDAVIISYGLGDPEAALSEDEFIYSRNRLNVSITRARAKSILFISRHLLDPMFEVLDSEAATEGLGFMRALEDFCRERGESREAMRIRDSGQRVRMTMWRGN